MSQRESEGFRALADRIRQRGPSFEQAMVRETEKPVGSPFHTVAHTLRRMRSTRPMDRGAVRRPSQEGEHS